MTERSGSTQPEGLSDYGHLMTRMLGGAALPLACNMQFLRAPQAGVANLTSWGEWRRTNTGRLLPEALEALLPFQAPWTRMLTCQAAEWTVLVNNFVNGGDSSAPGPALARKLGVDCISASHSPPHGPGHAQTQLEVYGPDGAPPLMYRRTISATATDGRWAWDESGDPFAFEDTDRYAARRKQDRFDRALLLEYLAQLGVPIDDADYGVATLHLQIVSWPSREESLEEARADYAT